MDIHIDVSADEDARFGLYAAAGYELTVGGLSINMRAEQFQQLCDNLRPWVVDATPPAGAGEAVACRVLFCDGGKTDWFDGPPNGYVNAVAAGAAGNRIEFAYAAPTPLPEAVRADDRILWGVVANAGRLSRERKVRWSHVIDATGLGSTYSTDLCRRFGFDPNETIGGNADDGDEE